jgi:uncharacterized membrane protein YqiK
MVHPSQLTKNKGEAMLDLIGVIFMLFMGASIVIVVGAVAIWLGETTYKRNKRKGKVW